MSALQIPHEAEDFHRQRVEQEVSLCSKDRKEILRNIAEMAFHPLGPRDEGQRVSQTTARFAALLVSLSVQADAQFQKNVEIQEKLIRLNTWLIGLTVALLVFTAILAFR